MKHVVLSQTCQGQIFRHLLLSSPAFCQDYTCTFVPNYDVSEGKGKLASTSALEAALPHCDLLVYHDIAAYDFKTLCALLPAGAQALKIPYVTSNIYWPSYEVLNPIWLAPTEATAIIPWPCRLLNDLIVRLRDKTRILSAYCNLDIPEHLDVDKNFKQQVRYLQKAEAGTIFSVADFVQEHYVGQQLFHLINHPGISVFVSMANTLFAYLGLPPLPAQTTDPFAEHQIPVHPSIIRYYALTWCNRDTRYQLWEKRFSHEEYVLFYIDNYIQSYGFDPFPPPRKGNAKHWTWRHPLDKITNLFNRRDK